MSITKTIGGDRLGAGKKMKASLHNYERSTFNLTRKWKSTMAPGVLTPQFIDVGLNGDTWDIDINSLLRTIPTQGPLLGTFKYQVDFFQCPVRLYQGILHNNPINIGLKMKDVTYPVIKPITYLPDASEFGLEARLNATKFNNTCLLKYLGISGIGGVAENSEDGESAYLHRNFNGIPVIAYYDIFKNYYANKQEKDFYVINKGIDNKEKAIIETGYSLNAGMKGSALFNIDDITCAYTLTKEQQYVEGVTGQNITANKLSVKVYAVENSAFVLKWYGSLEEFKQSKYVVKNSVTYEHDTKFAYNFATKKWDENTSYTWKFNGATGSYFICLDANEHAFSKDEISLQNYPLENIDKMRELILSLNSINERLVIDENLLFKDELPAEPYITLTTTDVYADGIEKTTNAAEMYGLCVKTYQSDLFNAWLDTEQIDGENGIAAITTIDTSDGLNLDTLNLAQKVYNMLNRIVTAGNTYEDWQEAVWGEKAIRHAETPIYLGGMSSEIVFDEVVSTAATGEENPLGSLAGRGTLSGYKGGKLHIKINEPSFIIAIGSITPRLDYTQGNKWFMTDLFSNDDLHKPALDGIGFQNLMVSQMHYKGDVFDEDLNMIRNTAGKVPAWMNYMTAVDEAYGEFADEEGKNFMILARNYETDIVDGVEKVVDLTTYIDPAKYNYAFAYSSRAAQNFWVQMLFEVKCRRKMSAKLIPNL